MTQVQQRGPMATDRQRLAEERAIAIFDMPEVREARARTLAHFHADRNASQPGQDALIEQSVDAHHFHAALMAASETPEDPAFIWAIAAPHSWMGMGVPDSRFGQDNPDNCYRLAAIDPARRYRVSGRLPNGDWATDFSLSAAAGQLGENILADTRALITPDMIDLDAAGRFMIDVDADATNGRRNHLCIAGARMLFARDTLGDWSRELPSELDIACLDAGGGATFDMAVAAQRAAGLGETMARFMLEVLQHGMFERGPLNELMPPWSAGENGGLATQASSLGHYRIEEDEAMVICAGQNGARYMGMQITDIWMLSYNYWDRTSCLNHVQASADGDGKVRWVISVRDPGVANWLDSGGHRHGTILLRWQHLPAGTTLTAEDISTVTVPIGDIWDHLPADTRKAGPDERTAQRRQRQVDYQRRLAGSSPHKDGS